MSLQCVYVRKRASCTSTSIGVVKHARRVRQGPVRLEIVTRSIVYINTLVYTPDPLLHLCPLIYSTTGLIFSTFRVPVCGGVVSRGRRPLTRVDVYR